MSISLIHSLPNIKHEEKYVNFQSDLKMLQFTLMFNVNMQICYTTTKYGFLSRNMLEKAVL